MNRALHSTAPVNRPLSKRYAAGPAAAGRPSHRSFGLPPQRLAGGGLLTLGFLLLVLIGLRPVTLNAANWDAPLLECGNLVYAGNQSSVCFADRFLTEVERQTHLRVNKKFCPVRLDADALFDYPFAVMSGNDHFALSERERNQMRRYLQYGGFLLVSPGCSDTKWDRAFRREIKLCFPDHELARIPMDHPVFNVVHRIPRLTDKKGRTVLIEGLHLNGRLVLVYSTEGLNDVANAKGCCCCGGNEITNPALVNVNVFTYAVLY